MIVRTPEERSMEQTASTQVKLAIQTGLLPGRDLQEQFANAARYGYDGVEVNISPAFHLDERLNDLLAASESSGLPVSSICTHSIHDPLRMDPIDRNHRFERLSQLLELADELGAAGVVSVPVRPPSTFPGEQSVNDDPYALAAVMYGEWAATLPAGKSQLFLEPLNRFEASFMNRVEQAADLARRVNHPRVVALADLFHMNIEESSMAAPIIDAGPLLRHVHIADNNRHVPGDGCLTFAIPFSALNQINYQGWLALACNAPGGSRTSPEAEAAYTQSAKFVRNAWAGL
jgi:sugar phosphate isomerase/epimerase